MKGLKLISLIAPLALTLGVAATQARAEHGPDHRSGPCRQDVQALCPSVTPGPGSFHYCLGTLCPDLEKRPGAFVDCLEKFSDKLSPACQQHLTDVKAEMAARQQAFQQACGTDVQSFCSQSGGDRRATFKCLHEHKSELSQSCQDLLASHHKWHHEHGTNPAPSA